MQWFSICEAPEFDWSIYQKCALLRTHFFRCNAKINQITKLLEISCIHNHDANANNDEKIILSKQIKRKAEISSSNLPKVLV